MPRWPPPTPPSQVPILSPTGSTGLVQPDVRSTALALPQVTPQQFENAVSGAAEDIRASRAKNTHRAYESDWRSWTAWCVKYGQRALPAESGAIALYLSTKSREGRKHSTLSRHVATISRMHIQKGYRNPEGSPQANPTQALAVREMLEGIARLRGKRSVQKAPVGLPELERMLVHARTDLIRGIRDRALLLVDFAGAFRRSELVALDIGDLRWTAEGVLITVRRSKTDQMGEGIDKPIAFTGGPLCAATALRSWLAVLQNPTSNIVRRNPNGSIRADEPVFHRITKHETVAGRLSGGAVALIIKGYAAKAGINPRDVSGHSLRAGHVTQRLDAGEDPLTIMDVTGHASLATLKKYDRRKRKDPFHAAMRGPGGKK